MPSCTLSSLNLQHQQVLLGYFIQVSFSFFHALFLSLLVCYLSCTTKTVYGSVNFTVTDDKNDLRHVCFKQENKHVLRENC
jgi:hypothetical protein